jgi:PAS domain S-box-containing protein
MALALNTGRQQVGEEIVIERPDGSRRIALAHATPLRNRSGRVIGAVNVLVDITESRRAELAQSQLAAIVESTSDAIVSKDLDGRITSWNAGAERLFGYTADEMIGAPILRLIPPERHEEERDILARIRRGEWIEHFETVRITKGGRRIDVSLTISPVRDAAGRIVGASKAARDITAQKQAAEALRDSEQRFAQFMHHLPGLAWIKNHDGKYVFVNEAAERAFQKTRSEVVGRCDEEIFPAETAAEFRAHDRQVLTSGVGGEVVETLQHSDGLHHSIVTKFPIPGPSGGPAMVGGIAIDITRRKQAEQALVALKDELAGQLADLWRLHGMSVRLSTTLELQPIMDEALRTAAAIEESDLGILSLHDPDQNALALRASLGFDDEFLNAVALVPLGEGACGACFEKRQRVVVEDVETDHIFAPFRELARRTGFRAVHSTPLITRSGKIVGVLSIYFRRPHRPSDRAMRLIDLCARQAADFIENARLYAELVEADRQKDEYLATLAHELRNPLAPICNSLHLLRLSDDHMPAVRHVREIMERQVAHMVRLVDDLLEVSRIGQGKLELRKELVELSAVIGSAIETSRPLIEAANHQLAVTLPAEALLVHADPMRLAQVIANLLNNATKYTPQGGQIWLSARRESGRAVVSVRDNGQGIPSEALPRVFDMFAQAEQHPNAVRPGLGIGLALAQRLIQLHGGAIDAHSDGVGRGSEFIVQMPLAAEPGQVELPAKIIPSTTAVSLTPRRILIVDDTESSAFVLGKLLENIGQHVSTAEDPVSALTLARNLRPHVIISDIAMPQMNGYELARNLRREATLNGTVLVALTGYAQEEHRQQALDAGFDFYLVKPVSLDSLRELLASLPPPPEPAVVLHLQPTEVQTHA